MRPTREAPETKNRHGLVLHGIGVDPVLPTTDPPDPVDLAISGQAYVPFINPGAAGVAQFKSGRGSGFGIPVTVTLDESPTIGNILVAHVGLDNDSDPVYSLNNGTWTEHPENPVYSGAGTNWPHRVFYQVVTGSTSAVTTVSVSGGSGTGTLRVGIIELTGVDAIDDTVSTTNSATTTGSLTPTGSLPAVFVSSVLSRNLTPNSLTPATGMTEWDEVGVVTDDTKSMAFNYRVIASTSGSYTVGSTGAAANSSMLGAAFVDTGASVNWIDGPLTIDDDDTTYEYASGGTITGTTGPFWRIDLGDTYLFDSIIAKIGFENAGAVTVLLQGANEADFSDAVTIETLAVTATGSYTSDTLTGDWTPTTAYRYAQLVLDSAAQGVHIFEVSLTAPAAFTGVHGDLTGRDVADQHPADAVSVDTTGFTNSSATELQTLAEDFDTAIAAGGDTFGDLGWFNVMDYGATGDGTTNDTAAIQAAIDACETANGGTVYFPVGEYVISGALQDTGARNGQLLIPTIATSAPQITMRFLGGGARPPFAPAGPVPDPGGYSIIRSTLTGASGTAACISGGNEVFTSKNNVSVVVENLLCMAPDNPTFTFWNLSSTQGGAIRDLMVTMTGWAATTVPTNANSYGLRLPQRGQSNYTYVDGYCCYIFYTGLQVGELTIAKGLIFAGNDAAVELTEAPHPSLIVNMHQTGSRTGIRVVEGTATWPVRCDVLLYNSEHMDSASGALVETDYDLDDPDDAYLGTITYGNALNSGPVDPNFLVNSGANAIIRAIGEAPSGVAALDDLTDVTLTSPQEDDDLRYNGSAWVNDARKWEAVTDGEDVFVWDGDDLVHEWNA